ncbi:hypothetical protein Nmel_000877 [Mimus melanotis]
MQFGELEMLLLEISGVRKILGTGTLETPPRKLKYKQLTKKIPFCYAKSSSLHSNSDKGDGSVKYILTGEGAGTIFIIDDTTGDIHSTKSLDREQKTHYVLHAQAIDRRTNKPLEPESEFIIKVQDINDNAPKFTDGPYIVTVPEMSEMGTSVLQVTATDADDPTYGNSARVVYSILQGQPYFSVDPKTGSQAAIANKLDEWFG